MELVTLNITGWFLCSMWDVGSGLVDILTGLHGGGDRGLGDGWMACGASRCTMVQGEVQVVQQGNTYKVGEQVQIVLSGQAEGRVVVTAAALEPGEGWKGGRLQGPPGGGRRGVPGAQVRGGLVVTMPPQLTPIIDST